MEDWRSHARKSHEDKSRVGRFKLAEGTNHIRILPGLDAKGKPSDKVAPFVEYTACRDVGPDNRFMTSGRQVGGGGDCWLCDVMIPKLLESEKKSVRDKAKAMAPIDMLIVQIMYRGSDGEWAGPVSWQPSYGGPRSIGTELMRLLGKENLDLISPAKGRALEIDRTGQGLQTRYGAILPGDSPTPVPKEILKKIKPLTELFPQYDEDEMQDAYFGREAQEDGPTAADQADMERDSAKAEKKKKKAKAGSFDTTDDKPKKKGKKKKSKKG